jgi:hypothetical protein
MTSQSRTRWSLSSCLRLLALPLIGLTSTACLGEEPTPEDLELGLEEQSLEGSLGGGAYWITGINGQCHAGDHSRYTNCFSNVGTSDYLQCVNSTSSNYIECERDSGQFDTCDVLCPTGSAQLSSHTSPMCNNDRCCRTNTQLTCKQFVCGNGVRETGAFGFGEQCDNGSGNTNTVMTCAPGQTSCSNCSASCRTQPGIPNPSPQMTLTLDANTIDYDRSAVLRWTSTNADRCVNNTSGLALAPSGSLVSGSLYRNTSFSITCTGRGGSVTATQDVVVRAAPPHDYVFSIGFYFRYYLRPGCNWESTYMNEETLFCTNGGIRESYAKLYGRGTDRCSLALGPKGTRLEVGARNPGGIPYTGQQFDCRDYDYRIY